MGLDEWRDLFATGEDPAQQVVARQDGRLVGITLGMVFADGTGRVDQPAVRRDQQGHGLGTALRLYQRLGLTIDRQRMVHQAPSTT